MTEIRVPLCDTLTDLGLLIDKNTSIPCLLPPCFIQNLPSYSFGMIPSLHWPYKNNFLGVDLFPSFPAGRNRYGLLIFTSWGKKPNTQRFIPIGGRLQLPSSLPWNRTWLMSPIWSSQHHKKCTSDRNLLVTRATLIRVRLQQSHKGGMCCTRRNRCLPERVHRD